jgi:hypothetical protein
VLNSEMSSLVSYVCTLLRGNWHRKETGESGGGSDLLWPHPSLNGCGLRCRTQAGRVGG